MTILIWLALIMLPLGLISAVFNAGFACGRRMERMRKRDDSQ